MIQAFKARVVLLAQCMQLLLDRFGLGGRIFNHPAPALAVINDSAQYAKEQAAEYRQLHRLMSQQKECKHNSADQGRYGENNERRTHKEIKEREDNDRKENVIMEQQPLSHQENKVVIKQKSK